MYVYLYTHNMYICTELLTQDAIRGVTKLWATRKEDNCCSHKESQGSALHQSEKEYLLLLVDLNNSYLCLSTGAQG